MLTKSEIKANRQMWYDELMSGKHKQTTLCLEDRKGKCCLGVACHVAVREGVIPEPEILSNGEALYDGNDTGLPHFVSNWLGFETSDPITEEKHYFAVDGNKQSFAQLNDDSGKSFEQIAAILKRDFIDTMEEEDVDKE